MTTTRFTNTGHPQTLQAAVVLLYISAVFAILGSAGGGSPPVLNLIVGIVGGVGAYLLANNRRIGLYLGLVGAIGPTALVLIYNLGLVLDINLYRFLFWYPYVIGLIFDIAIAVALLHPMSRNYMKVWFD
jgi:hypothetical protein